MPIIINDGFEKLQKIPKPRVRGVVRRRNSKDYKDMLLPTMLRLTWNQEEKIKNALLYGHWGRSQLEALLPGQNIANIEWGLSPDFIREYPNRSGSDATTKTNSPGPTGEPEPDA